MARKMKLLAGSAGVFALATAIVQTPVAMASTPPMFYTKITLNGKVMPSPKGFIYEKTTYMPIYYVEDVLKALGVQTSWKYVSSSVQTWTLNTGSTISNPPNLNAKSGTVNIVLNGKTVEQKVVRHVARDPYSHVYTTYIPIWYIQQILNAVGVTNTWNGDPGVKTWGISGGYAAYGNNGSNLGTFLTLDQAKQALKSQASGKVVSLANGSVAYTQTDFTNVDLRYSAPASVTASSVDKYFNYENSPLSGLGQAFLYAQNTYGADANYLLSHAIEESGWGKSSIALAKNNLFGYGAYDSNPGNDAGMFPSEAYAILFQAWEVRNNYLNPGASLYVSPTLKGMNVHYASDSSWASNIGNLMNQFSSYVGDSVQSYKAYTSGQSAPAPQSNVEPAFYFNGATANTSANTYYGGVPVYSSPGVGADDMFTRNLQNGTYGSDVAELQSILNQQENAGLTVDGQFGPMTQTALEKFESSHGAANVDGVCDFGEWSQLLQVPGPQTLLPAGQTVNIDQMEQGLLAGYVVPWYHVQNVGWISGRYVQFTNVYRITVNNPTSPSGVNVPVYSPSDNTTVIGTLRAGDFVVSTNPQGTGSSIPIQFSNVLDSSHALISGVIHPSDATLTQQTS